ncbi:17145_t:CDS:1, partial [Racocetra fulgida]
MPEKTRMIFNEINEIKDEVYCQPKNQNFSSIDAIIAPNVLFQITVFCVYPIKLNGLKQLYD